MLRTKRVVLALLAAVAVACTEATGPGPSEPADGIGFGLGDESRTHQASEGPDPDNPFGSDFAVVTGPDSIGGLVILSYNAETSDLFVLQVTERAEDEYVCTGPYTATDCHGRLLRGVRVEQETIVADAFYEMTSGRVDLERVDAERVEGTFSGRLESTADSTALDVAEGRFSLAYDEGALADGRLLCLIDAGSCGEP